MVFVTIYYYRIDDAGKQISDVRKRVVFAPQCWDVVAELRASGNEIQYIQ